MPTTAVMTYSGVKLEPAQFPELARTIAVKLPASVNYPRGTVLGELTATPGTYTQYLTGASTGAETAKALLVFDCQTDASGNITLSSVASTAGDEWGAKQVSVAAYVAGYFKTTELTGLDAAGIVDLGGNLVSGVLADGVLRIG
jgi:hypothetical protein